MGIGKTFGGLMDKAQGVAGGLGDLVQKNPALAMMVPQQFRLPLMLLSLKNGKSETGQQVVPSEGLAGERENTAKQFETFAAMSSDQQQAFIAGVRAGDTKGLEQINASAVSQASQITVSEVDAPTPPQTPAAPVGVGLRSAEI